METLNAGNYAPLMVEAKGLVKVFRDFWRRPKVRAVDGIDFNVGSGEIVGLLGPNGSGKSTTIKMLLGLLFPSEGSVRVLGESPQRVTARQQIGYLPEVSELYLFLTPRETLDFYGRLFDLKPKTRRSRIEQLLEMVGLTHAADRQVGEFSMGMKRRVGLAQALVNDPQLLVLDEPTAGLDPPACRQVKDTMLAMVRRGKSIVLSSHLLADVESVCDRLVILYNGRIRAQGSVKELLTQSDRLSVTMPALPPEKMKSLLQTLRDHIGEEPQVEHPSLDLERFFLNVIEDAGDSQLTGAGHHEGIARYLDGTQ